MQHAVVTAIRERHAPTLMGNYDQADGNVKIFWQIPRCILNIECVNAALSELY